jgi:hypothetical protein
MLGVAAPPAAAQFGWAGFLGALNAVLNTINRVIKGLFDTANNALSQISSVIGAFRNLMETVVYPQSLLNRARGLAGSLSAQFRGLLSAIFNIGVSSAQLPAPASLEAVLRNRNTSDFGALASAYAQTYGAMPSQTDADPIDRDLVDMDDAAALATLKMLKSADAASDRSIAAALLIEDEGGQVAPGTADYLVAAGLIAAVQNQAVIQKMLAAQMRQEAARLAHQNMIRKRNATFASGLRSEVTGMVSSR